MIQKLNFIAGRSRAPDVHAGSGPGHRILAIIASLSAKNSAKILFWRHTMESLTLLLATKAGFVFGENKMARSDARNHVEAFSRNPSPHR